MWRSVLLVLGLTGLSLPGFSESSMEGTFHRDIRPLLSSKCFQCHGPDEETRAARLRLDVAEEAFSGRGGHPAIVPGEPDASEVMRRILSDNPNLRMPPPEAGDALTEEETALLRAWIAQGAVWEPHWAFVPPKKTALPEPVNTGWARNPIDHFVLARLEREEFEPNSEADRPTLVRRLHLDLLGLPPTVEELDQALSGTSDDWYESLVDRLLASPHYGERWARHWMDAAQYADSDGFEKDKPREVWAWRDWVVRALNENMPYDQFITEQIAGDLLPEATPDQRIATGFLRNSMINEEGGIEPEQFRMEALFNRMEIVGRAVLGLTVQCAQCHTHKYDPLTHGEYFRMLAFLNNGHEASLSVYSAAEEQQRAALHQLIEAVEGEVRQKKPDWREAMAAWEAEAQAIPAPHWEPLSFVFDDTSAGGQKCLPQGDGSYLAQGYAPTQFQPKMTATTQMRRITAVRLELLPDPNLPRGGHGRSVHGTAALSEFELRIAPADTAIANYDDWTPVPIASAIADLNPPQRPLGPEFPLRGEDARVTGPIEFAIDGKRETAWTTQIDPVRNTHPRQAIFRLAEPLDVPEGHALAFRLAQLHGGWNSDDTQTNNLGRFRISVTDADEVPDRIVPQVVQAALALPPEERSADQQQAVFHQWLLEERALAEAHLRLEALLQAHPSGATQLVYQERDAPRTTHRLERGDFLSPLEAVTPGVPEFLHPLQVDGAPNRLDFARWLVARESPTTARAFVNRVWQHYFGHGLSTTSSDLGLQGEMPSHPELLDWLAVEFMESGWDIKHLHRIIVGSATYQQDSRVTPDQLARDPDNRLLARGARFRVEGETVRDIALAAGGLLNPAVGGPSVYPPAPQFLFEPPASYGPKTWNHEQGANKYRRALYTFRFRSVPYPVLQVFDTPAGDAPCTRRERSNTPLQALATLNEPIFLECARGLAEQTLAMFRKDSHNALNYAFLRTVSREPAPEEKEVLLQFLQKQYQRLEAGELQPAEVLKSAGGTGEVEDATALAAWTLTARVLLNLDETITRQ